MNPEQMISQSVMQKTFRLPSWWFAVALIPLIIGLVFVGSLTIVAEGDVAILIPALFGFVLFLVISVFVFIGARSTRLVVTSGDITYYSLGYSIRAAWPNVVGVREGQSRTLDVLELAQPPLLEVSPQLRGGQDARDPGVLAKVRLLNILTFRPAITEAISVGVFGSAWTEGELRTVVQQYAPQAFERE